jgi:hypothetical protein
MGVGHRRQGASLDDRGKVLVVHDPYPTTTLTHDKGRYHA